MKDWGWFILLTIGCLISAVIIVLIFEVLKDLPYFKGGEINSAPTAVSEYTVIDNVISSSPSATAIITASTNTNNFPPDSNNLIANASFEFNPLTNSSRWQTTKLGNQQIIEWSTEQAVTGQHALKISAAKANIGWPGWLTQLNHRASSGYKLQAKYYTQDGANAWLELSFFDSNNRLIKGFSTGCPQTSVNNQWTLVERTVKAEWIPKASHTIQIGLRQCLNYTKDQRTTLYFDDVSLHYLSD